MKTCNRCLEPKPFGEFFKNASGAFGLNGRCKSCIREYKELRKQQDAVVDGDRTCSKCLTAKPVTSFGLNSNGKQGRASACDECRNEDSRRLHLKRHFGLTLEEYDAMVEAQEGRCAICGDECKLVVDHDHETGVVRGLLCSMCNSGMGMLGDDVGRVMSAAAYLESHKMKALLQ